MEFFNNLLNFPLAESVANLHGLLATLSLLVFGAIFAIIGAFKKYQLETLFKPLACLLGVQSLLVGATSTMGIVAYVAYRTSGGAREFLLRSGQTDWLHKIVFEYKEYLCGITPWLLIMVAFFVVLTIGPSLYRQRSMLRFILASTAVSAFFLMLTASLAVLVSKVAPLQKFQVGGDLFTKGGNLVILTAVLTAILIAGTFWLVTRKARKTAPDNANYNSAVSMMYGSAFGLTVMWVLNIVKEASAPLKQSLAYITGIGPYSGVLIWSLAAIIVATIVIWLITLKRKPLSMNKAGWTLVVCALVQVIIFFPPFYGLLID